VCQAEEAIVVESAKMQFSGRGVTSPSTDDVQDKKQQQQQPVTSDDARPLNNLAANQQSRRANRFHDHAEGTGSCSMRRLSVAQYGSLTTMFI